MRFIAALTVPVLTLGTAVLVASPASAHTPSISADCGGVHVGATAYDAGMQNRWSVTIDGVTQSGTFGASFDQTFPVPQDGATTDWSAFVEAADGSYHGEGAGTVGPCGTPPPTDACADLPGPQPAGTPCTPPPDVQRAEQQVLEGCHVSFQGTDYGAGALAYDEEYTDTYVFDEQTNTWDLVTDTTATIANLEFTPWTTRDQVEHGCAKKPHQPPAQHTRHSETRLSCGDDVQVTTTWTVTTPYVYDEETNTWVPGKPVEHKTTHQTPVKPGQCGDTEVLPAQAAAPASPAAGAQVPTVIDAGTAGAPAVARLVPASATRATAAASVAPGAGSPRVPALLLVSGAVLLVGGGLRLRRG